jgi:hypothetical protein
MGFWILDFGFWIVVDGFVYARNRRNTPLTTERTRPTPPATVDYWREIVKKF